MTDGNEHAIERMALIAPVFLFSSRTPVTTSGVPPPSISSTTLSQIALIFGLANRRCLQDLFRAQRVAAVDQGDAVGVMRKVERFLDRRVAAADHRDALAAIEEAIAGGAGRDAAALQAFFRVDAEPAGLGAGRDDHDLVGEEGITRISHAAERLGREIDAA